jgi:hypothetical protein
MNWQRFLLDILRCRYAVRVVGEGDRWLYFSGAVGIQAGPRNTRDKGSLRDAMDLIDAARKAPASRRWLTGLCEGDRFKLVRLVPVSKTSAEKPGSTEPK